MVRSYAMNWLGSKDQEINRIFGPSPKSGRHQVGSVVFLDAIPTFPVRLKAEIMTPHYVPYYTGSDPKPPGDWHNPVPIPFLAVDEGQEFLFGVLPRSERDGMDCEKASQWLSESLIMMGAGAKTSSGYGRFSRVELKNKGMRWLALVSRENGKDAAGFLNGSPKIAREEWTKIGDPEIKTLAAKEIKRQYQLKNSWDQPIGERKKFKAALEEHLATIIGESQA
jgi:CRISPR-associated protein Cmr6